MEKHEILPGKNGQDFFVDAGRIPSLSLEGKVAR